MLPAGASLLHDAATGRPADDAPSACEFPALSQRRGLMVQPARGDAIRFYNQLANGSLDGRTRHGSCPVLRVRKEVLNVWLWNKDVIYR